MPISIRLATLEDIPPLQQLIPESVRALSATYYNSDQIESALIYIFGVDTQLIRDKTYFVWNQVKILRESAPFTFIRAGREKE